ncbi:MAG: hypothetical protein J6332_00160 [Abditibacteriota bacterium]|nr:hypothetical protein [Abditibacteriota bacterium]
MNLKDFKNPESFMRPAPFWAINDRLDPKEVDRQLRDMRDKGYGGAFFHARHGLTTDYMSDEWFESMDAALKVAEETDGKLYLYDEDLWPSGNAGGLVAGMDDEFRSALLVGTIIAPGDDIPALTEDESVRFLYVIKDRDGLDLKDFEAVDPAKADDYKDAERIVLVRRYTPKIPWWSNESYANLINPKSVKKFIEMTHEKYAAKYGDKFGTDKEIPGIFTDEPQLAFCPYGFAWDEGLPEFYASVTGRDFVKDLPYMYFNGPESRYIRLVMHRTLLNRFLESYSKPIFEWCDKHNLAHTGHYNAEDTFRSQILCHMGAVMNHYRYQHIPGIDHLCRQLNGYSPHNISHANFATGMTFTMKQVSSAARQLGRKRVLCELFGVSRHTNTFEGLKWIGDYNLVNGINLFCPHLTLYSAKGRRKRDFPPNFNYQQSYWEEMKPLNDYFGRLCYALTRGEADASVAVIHTIESATAEHSYSLDTTPAAKAGKAITPGSVPTENLEGPAGFFDFQMRKALDTALYAGYDTDIAEENYIKDLGSVEGDKFVIGEMKYKVMILPVATTVRRETFDLLKEFLSGGGVLIVMGDTPKEIDCKDASEEWKALSDMEGFVSIPAEWHALDQVLDELYPQSFTVKGIDGTSYPDTYLMHRVNGNEEIFFVVNSDTSAARTYTATFFEPGDKDLYLWDALKGTCEPLVLREAEEDVYTYTFTLPPAGSILLTLSEDGYGDCESSGASVAEIRKECLEGEVCPLVDCYEFTRNDENVLVMDKMEVSFDDGATFEPADYDFRVRPKIADKFGTTPALQWQPWVAIRKHLFDDKVGDIVLRYRFETTLETTPASVVIENLKKGKLFVNGKAVDISGATWKWDRDFGKVNITDYIKQGENIIDFKMTFNFLAEVEPAYIVGDFGVAQVNPYKFVIVEEPEELDSGSITRQGYPFYCGSMTYKVNVTLEDEQFEKYLLRLVKPCGTLFKVKVNGEDAGKMLWHPFVCDLTEFLKPGDNTIEVELFTSMQNAWGPLHEKNGDDNSWCGPGAFTQEHMVRNEYNNYDYGLLGGMELIAVEK